MRRRGAASLTATEARAQVLDLTLGILRAAGRPFRRRRAFRQGHAVADLAELDPDLQRATELFDCGKRRGLELHDRTTASMLARACCVPNSAWERRELPRALHLFEATLQPANRGQLRQRWTCEAVACERIARYGDASIGVARACEEHRRLDEQRVDLNTEAALAIADSAVQSEEALPLHLEAAVRLYLYVAHAAVRSGHEPEHGGPDEQLGVFLAALTRLFSACSAAQQLPQQTMLLVPALVGSVAAPGAQDGAIDGARDGAQDGARDGALLGTVGAPGALSVVADGASRAADGGLAGDVGDALGAADDERLLRRRRALNALIHACGRAGAVEAAWQAHGAGVAAGLPVDRYTVTALVSAASRTRERTRIAAALAIGTEAGIAVHADPFVVSALLKAHALAGEHDAAFEAYERALAEGMRPTLAVTNALSLVYAATGDIERATSLFERARNALADETSSDAWTTEAMPDVAMPEAVASLSHQTRSATDRQHADADADAGSGAGSGAGARAEGTSAVPSAGERRGRDEDTAVSTLLHACVQAGAPERALATFEVLAANGYVPSGTSPHAVLLRAAAEAAAADGAAHDADERRAAARSLHRIVQEALAAGVTPDTRLLSALVSACARIGDPPAALRGARLSEALGVRPDLRLLRAVLQASMRAPMPQREALGWVMEAAAVHGIELRDVADLLLRAHLARAPRRSSRRATAHPPAPASPTRLDAALEVFERARRHEWPLTAQTHRTLLSACAQHDRMAEALELLEYMESREHAPGLAALDDLMSASHRAGDINDHTLALWMAGSAEEAQLVGAQHGRSHSTQDLQSTYDIQ